MDRRAEGPAHLSQGAHLLEGPLKLDAPLLQLGRSLADAILQRPVQLLQLGQRPLPLVDADLQRSGHPVEGGGELADLVARLYRDLLLQTACRDLLGLLGQPLDGVRDAAREPVDEERADDQERQGDAAPQLRQFPRLPLDARQREPEPHGADDPPAGRRRPRPRARLDQQFFRRLRGFGQDRRHELDEPLVGALHAARERAIDDGVGRSAGEGDLAATVREDLAVATLDHDVSDVGIPQRTSDGRLQELPVLAEDSQLTGESQVRGQGSPSLLELVGDEAPVLAHIHPALEDEKRHDDRDDRPEHPGPEARETPEQGPERHWITLVARARMVWGICIPSFSAALRLTTRLSFRAVV